jgi:hypothetical protein
MIVKKQRLQATSLCTRQHARRGLNTTGEPMDAITASTEMLIGIVAASTAKLQRETHRRRHHASRRPEPMFKIAV